MVASMLIEKLLNSQVSLCRLSFCRRGRPEALVEPYENAFRCLACVRADKVIRPSRLELLRMLASTLSDQPQFPM